MMMMMMIMMITLKSIILESVTRAVKRLFILIAC